MLLDMPIDANPLANAESDVRCSSWLGIATQSAIGCGAAAVSVLAEDPETLERKAGSLERNQLPGVGLRGVSSG